MTDMVKFTNAAAALARGLADGYGVEDVAVMTGLPVDKLRDEMRAFIADGRARVCIKEARRRAAAGRG